ncbi:hypothetical protein MKX01_034745 [Papaver californicum]|nr:hypothetical protein MKX01_034745 [Papaver californicum]
MKKESPDGTVDIPVLYIATHVFGRDGKGYVHGMGGNISKKEMLASAACREQLRVEKLKNQGLQTQLNILEARFNDFESGSGDWMYLEEFKELGSCGWTC